MEDIKQRIENAIALDFGGIFSKSIELFKKVWVQGLVTILLNLVLAIPFIMIVYIPLIVMGITEGYTPQNSYAQPNLGAGAISVMGLLYLFMIVAMSTIGFGLKAAFYRICRLKDLEQMGKEDYFYFFKKPYLKKTIMIALASTGIAVLAALLCFVPLIYAIVPLALLIVVYAFNPDMSISELIKLSFDLGNKKWMITFGLILVCGFLASIVGFVMCFVGVYVTASFANLPQYFVYKEVIGFEDENTKRIEAL